MKGGKTRGRNGNWDWSVKFHLNNNNKMKKNLKRQIDLHG